MAGVRNDGGERFVLDLGAAVDIEVRQSGVDPVGKESLYTGRLQLDEGVDGEGSKSRTMNLDSFDQHSIREQVVLCRAVVSMQPCDCDYERND